jgi:hypothetical protein
MGFKSLSLPLYQNVFDTGGHMNTHIVMYCILTTVWLENFRRRDHVGNLDVEGKIILKWILGK